MNKLLYWKKSALNWFDNKNGDMAMKVQKMKQLFEEDSSIVIIGNSELDEQSNKLAKLLVTPLQMANDVVKSRLAQKLFNNP